MRIYRIFLRNYRVFEHPLEIEIPSGLVGIYGPNGAGKSYFIESIPWVLYGRSRTSIPDIRTSGTESDCEAEIEFEHDEHLVKIRRTISPRGLVKARGWMDNELISDGVKETNRFTQSTLGMDVDAFRASVFAEQKQVAAFSDSIPSERQKLVLSLLGIVPLDKARDLARTDFRNKIDQLKLARATLPSSEGLLQQRGELLDQLARINIQSESSLARIEKVTSELGFLEDEFRRLEKIKRQREQILAVGKEKRRFYDQLLTQIAKIDDSRKKLSELKSLVEKRSVDPGVLESLKIEISQLTLQIQATEDIVKVQSRLKELINNSGCDSIEHLEAKTEEISIQIIEVNSELEHLSEQISRKKFEAQATGEKVGRTKAQLDSLNQLGRESVCPTCGQLLGDAFQSHFIEEMGRYEILEAQLVELEREIRTLEENRRELQERHQQLKLRVDRNQRSLIEYSMMAQQVKEFRSQLEDLPAAKAHLAHLQAVLDGQAKEYERILRWEVEIKQLSDTVSAAYEVENNAELLAQELDELRNELSKLNFDEQRFEKVQSQFQKLAETVATAKEQQNQINLERMQLQGSVEKVEALIGQISDSRAAIDQAEAETDTLGRVADYLSEFRKSVISAMGPRLATVAASIFADLTESEYDLLDVDVDSWQIRISDRGSSYDLGRFSGSERDLANLAFRIAISEQIGSSFGQQVGLLVLDEVFGPLDDLRKVTLLSALDGLKSRFNQVMVVTHGSEIKEQMPGAIEITKIGPRRATAQVI